MMCEVKRKNTEPSCRAAEENEGKRRKTRKENLLEIISMADERSVRKGSVKDSLKGIEGENKP